MLPKKKPDGRQLLWLAPGAIAPNPAQPRRSFDPKQLESLAQSLRQHGVLQPLAVRRREGGYELIAGERRLRAARLAGLAAIPCVLTETDSRSSRILALVENFQRQDLHYLEEAAAIAELIREGDLSQEQAAEKLGYSQSAVANKLRLLRLSGDCCALLREGRLSERHARALLRLEEEDQRQEVLRRCIRRSLTVSQTETLVESLLRQNQTQPPQRRPTYIIKDVRLFLNSIDRHVGVMKSAGIPARLQREDSEEEILVTIRIPKQPGRGS